MNFSRREILKLLATSSAIPFVGINPLHTQDRIVQQYQLFFDNSSVVTMKHLFLHDSRFEYLRETLGNIDREEIQDFIASKVRFNDQLYDLVKLGTTAEQLSFWYLMTEDVDAAQLAIDCIDTVMKFPKWDYFLENGEQVIGVQRAPSTTLAVCLVSDWLGALIPPEKRVHWFEALVKKGIEPCYQSLYGIRFPETVKGWDFDQESTIFQHRPGNWTDLSRRPEITQNTNLRMIPASALAVGAVTYLSEYGNSDQTATWLEMVIHSLRIFEDVYENDGSYYEGIGYANYTTLHLVQAIEVLKRAHIADLRRLVNWKGYAKFVLEMTMPISTDTYWIVNFGDNGNPRTGERGSVERTAVPYWIAKNSNDGSAQWFASNLGGEADMWSLMWLDASMLVQTPSSKPHLYHSDLDWLVARTGYEASDLVVAFRSGKPGNHEHADRNSIVVKYLGEQLVTDPYRPPYSFSDPAWRMRLTEGHSAILIDGKGHEHHNGVEGTNASYAQAHLIETVDKETYAYWLSDASQAYRLVNHEIKSVIRGVMVFYEAPVIIIVDRITKWRVPSTIEARFFGDNWDNQCSIGIENNSFFVKRPNAIMKGTILSESTVKLASKHLEIPEAQAKQHPFVSVETATPQKEITLITALALGQDETTLPSVQATSINGGYQITVKSGTSTHFCQILDEEDIPQITF